ncbi:MAG TPA: HU family DNA-binding protein [Erysipelothrix sp.]|nr:HU family DNA-binding protein [Erysipelothrix sp.]
MSSTFNKKALADSLAIRLDITKKDATEIIEVLLEEIKDELKKGSKVDVAGFGRFEVKDRPERDGFNPQTKEKIRIPASKALTFRVSKALKNEINNKR